MWASTLLFDVLHSRVAHSTMHGLLRLGCSVVLVGPECFLPASYAREGVRVERDLDAVLLQRHAAGETV